MRFRVTMDGEEHKVLTVGRPGTVILDDRQFEGTIERPAKNRRVITMGERRYEVKVVEGEVSEGSFVLELAEGTRTALAQMGCASAAEASLDGLEARTYDAAATTGAALAGYGEPLPMWLH